MPRSTRSLYVVQINAINSGTVVEVEVEAHSKTGALRAFVSKMESYRLPPNNGSNLTHLVSFASGFQVYFNLSVIGIDDVIQQT